MWRSLIHEQVCHDMNDGVCVCVCVCVCCVCVCVCQATWFRNVWWLFSTWSHDWPRTCQQALLHQCSWHPHVLFNSSSVWPWTCPPTVCFKIKAKQRQTRFMRYQTTSLPSSYSISYQTVLAESIKKGSDPLVLALILKHNVQGQVHGQSDEELNSPWDTEVALKICLL